MSPPPPPFFISADSKGLTLHKTGAIPLVYLQQTLGCGERRREKAPKGSVALRSGRIKGLHSGQRNRSGGQRSLRAMGPLGVRAVVLDGGFMPDQSIW
jgi:hypothetical protein